MTANQILEKVKSIGGGLWVEGAQLKYRIPEREATLELLEVLQENKVQLMEVLMDSQPHPYFDDRGSLVIPFDCNPQYWWWAGGQSIQETLEELRKKNLNP